MFERLGRRDFGRYFARLSAFGVVASALGVGVASSGPGGVASGDPGEELTLASPGLSGLVRDARTKRPIARATVRLDWSGQSALTDSEGIFFLPAAPGTYAITASAPGYDPYSYSNRQAVSPDALVQPIVFDLFPEGGPTEADDLGALLGLQTELIPAESEMVGALAADGVLSPEALPTSILVYSEKNAFPPKWVPLEEYVKGVVPNEVYPSWPAESLKAQAVCARTYGVLQQLTAGFVWDNTRGQVYDPAKRTPQTDAATDATGGVCLYLGGAIINSLFFSRCNGSTTRDSQSAVVRNGSICTYVNWGVTAYLKARACGGHAASTLTDCGYYGHGVGMCQWGAWARGSQPYSQILMSYYTGCELRGNTPPPIYPIKMYLPNVRKGR